MELEFWTCQYFEKPPADEISDDEFDAQAEIDRINREEDARALAENNPDDWEDVINDRNQDPR